MVEKDTPPFFSVVIATYNYAHYIGAAIESALNQTDDCEIIVVDDGSKDNTREVVESYGKNIIYTYQENQGVSTARNHGARLATGQYLFFLDADDCILPDTLKLIRKQCLQYPEVDCFIGGRVSINEKGKTKTSSFASLSDSRFKNFSDFIHRKLGSATLCAVKRPILDTVNYPESLRNNEDVVFVAQLLACYNCRTISHPVIEVHLHDDSLRHNIDSVMDSSNKVADELFNPALLSAKYMALKNEFSSRVLLSRFRTLYLANKKPEARNLYHQAISLLPKNIFLFSYLKKYIRTYF